MRLACLDLGTNTALLLVGEYDPQSREWLKVYEDVSQYVRLGQGLSQTGRFHPEAITRLETALTKFSEILVRYQIDPRSLIAVATASARDARDSKQLFTDIHKRYGIEFRTITGEQEASLSFLGGVMTTSQASRSVVLDLGGGSTECQTALHGVSFPVGSVKLTEKFFPNSLVSDQEVWSAQEYLDTLFTAETPKLLHKDLSWIGVAGTCTTLAQMQLGLKDFDKEKIHGVELSCGDVHRWMSDLKMRPVQERIAIVGMDPNRADVIFAGALILWRVMEVFQVRTLKVSVRGLRYGLPQLLGD